jgi:hypothetical protein
MSYSNLSAYAKQWQINEPSSGIDYHNINIPDDKRLASMKPRNKTPPKTAWRANTYDPDYAKEQRNKIDPESKRRHEELKAQYPWFRALYAGKKDT